MNKNTRFARDTIIMTVSGLLTETVGVSFDVYLTRTIGASAMGLFRLVMTVYSLGVTFSCAGMRLAASRLTAEISARGAGTKSSASLCRKYALCVSLTAAAGLFIFADIAAKKWIGDSTAAMPLRVLSFGLPFVSLNAVFAGRAAALGFASEYSGIRLCEEVFRIICAVSVIRCAFPGFSACAAIGLATALSEVFSALLAAPLDAFHVRKEAGLPDGKPQMRSLLRLALPDLSGSSARSILLTVEHMLIPKGFEKNGASRESSLAAYGLIHSMALPVLLYPSALLSSVAQLMIPELARKKALGENASIERTAEKLLHLTLFFSLGTAAITFFFSLPLACAVGTPEAAHYIAVLSPLVPVMFCDTITDSLLRGLDEQLYTMGVNLFDSGLCVALVALLLPSFGIKGYIFILYLSEAVNFYLSTVRLVKICRVRFDIKKSLFKPLVFAVISCVPFTAVRDVLCSGKAMTAIAVSAAAVIYISLHLIFKHGKEGGLVNNRDTEGLSLDKLASGLFSG